MDAVDRRLIGLIRADWVVMEKMMQNEAKEFDSYDYQVLGVWPRNR